MNVISKAFKIKLNLNLNLNSFFLYKVFLFNSFRILFYYKFLYGKFSQDLLKHMLEVAKATSVYILISF